MSEDAGLELFAFQPDLGLRSAAVVKDSLTTETSANSPSEEDMLDAQTDVLLGCLEQLCDVRLVHGLGRFGCLGRGNFCICLAARSKSASTERGNASVSTR